MIDDDECKTPGCCTCKDMNRCPDCNYTEHDAKFWLDHKHCTYPISPKGKTKLGEVKEMFALGAKVVSTLPKWMREMQ